MYDDDLDLISSYLTEECKESYKKVDEGPPLNLKGRGRWSKEEWGAYVLFSLK